LAELVTGEGGGGNGDPKGYGDLVDALMAFTTVDVDSGAMADSRSDFAGGNALILP
jgi:hypothetical protein